MDDVVVPRTRNLRPRKPYVDPFAQPRRSVRRARARLSAADFYVLDNEEDGDWNGAADDDVGEDDVVELSVSSRRSHRSNRRTSGRRETQRSARSPPEPAAKKRTRKPKVLLPEDVPFRDPYAPQPAADPEDPEHAPSVAFIAIFVATFPSLFEDLERLPSPQDIEAGIVSPEPSALVEFIFRRVLGSVLNRKKEIEAGRYNSALSELHAQRNTLGMGPWFPPLQWKSKGNAFAELPWYDRLELLHVLIHWSLSASDRVRQLMRQLDDEAVKPWIASDEAGNHYYIVGFDPVAEGAEEHTPFRVYKESNRLLQTVKWEPVASSAAEVQAFIDAHVKTSPMEAGETAHGHHSVPQNITADADVADGQSDIAGEDSLNRSAAAAHPEGSSSQQEGAVAHESPIEYDLPQPLVDTLLYFLPAMYRSEAVTMERLQKEAKRARRRNDIMWQADTISSGGGRYAGRTRGRKINYAELLRDTVDEDEDEAPRKRRLRHRDTNYEWREPEPETRQQRHARIMAERAAERATWSSNDVSVAATPEYLPSALGRASAIGASENFDQLANAQEQNDGAVVEPWQGSASAEQNGHQNDTESSLAGWPETQVASTEHNQADSFQGPSASHSKQLQSDGASHEAPRDHTHLIASGPTDQQSVNSQLPSALNANSLASDTHDPERSEAMNLVAGVSSLAANGDRSSPA